MRTIIAAIGLASASSAAGQLCGDSAQTVSSTSAVCKADQRMAFGVVSWDGCCAYDTTEGQECRTYEQEGEAYTSTPTEGDLLVLQLAFDRENADQECCKSCTCYGDPECIAFDGTPDVWIPCDARRVGKDCHIYRDVCNDMEGPDGTSCKWLAGNKRSSAGRHWNLALQGSPCVPDLQNPVTMNMFSTDDFGVELELGERGIIQKVHMEIGSDTLTMDADDCFDYSSSEVHKAFGLSDASDLPEGFTVQELGIGEVSWTIRVNSDGSTVFVKLLCVRAVDGRKVGPPRINIEEITVPQDVSGDGFCATGLIGEKEDRGGNIDSTDIHASCVQNQFDAVQACKHLVSQAIPYAGLERCAADYCNVADLTPAEAKDCAKELGDGTNANKWVKYFCIAARNANPDAVPASTTVCRQMVKEEGWNWAVINYGNGYKDNTLVGDCSTNVNDFAIEEGSTMCGSGVYIDAMIDGEFQSQYFIPATTPLCSDTIVFNGKQSPKLFENLVRLRQCDNSKEEKCAAEPTCGPILGVDFEMTFTNQQAELNNLLEQNVLQCIPKMVDGKLSNDWCFIGSLGYTPEEVCTCPPDNRRLDEILA